MKILKILLQKKELASLLKGGANSFEVLIIFGERVQANLHYI